MCVCVCVWYIPHVFQDVFWMMTFVVRSNYFLGPVLGGAWGVFKFQFFVRYCQCFVQQL